MDDAERRGLLTAVVLVAAVALQWLPLPGVSLLDVGWPTELLEARSRLFGLGLAPYIAATGLLVLLSGAVPSLGRLRDQTGSTGVGFDQCCTVLAAAIAAVQGLALSYFSGLSSLAFAGMPTGVSALLTCASTVAATMLLIWLAARISRDGVGNGLALLVVAIGFVPPWVFRTLRGSGTGMLMLLVFALAAIAASVAWFNASSQVPLEPADGPGSAEPALVPAPVIPIRFNLLGIIPVSLAIALLVMVDGVYGLFPSGSNTWLSTTHPLEFEIMFGLLVLLSSQWWVRAAFDLAHLDRVLDRHGYRVANAPPGTRASAVVERILARQTLPAAFAMVAFVLATKYCSIEGATLAGLGLDGPSILLATAIVIDTRRNWSVHRLLAGRVEELQVRDEGVAGEVGAESMQSEEVSFVELTETDTELEADLIRDRLVRAGTEAHVLSNRALPLWGTLGLWEWTVPRFPAFLPYRRIAGGRVVVVVSSARVEVSQALLERPAEPPSVDPMLSAVPFEGAGPA